MSKFPRLRRINLLKSIANVLFFGKSTAHDQSLQVASCNSLCAARGRGKRNPEKCKNNEINKEYPKLSSERKHFVWFRVIKKCYVFKYFLNIF